MHAGQLILVGVGSAIFVWFTVSAIILIFHMKEQAEMIADVILGLPRRL